MKKETVIANYKVIIESSKKEMTAKERISAKDTADCVKLDSCELPLIIDVNNVIVLNIHNEKSDDIDYRNYVIVSKDGTKYVTGSQSLYNSLENICEEMKEEKEEWGIKVFKLPSKNYTGKEFLTCSIV